MLSKASKSALAVTMALLLGTTAAIPQTSAPDRLIIYSENDDRIDTTRAACVRIARDLMVNPNPDEDSIREVCAARAAAAKAYRDMQATYREFMRVIGIDTRLEIGKAVDHLRSHVKNCIDYANSLSTGGRNIYMDVIPHRISARCFTVGKNLMDEDINESKAFIKNVEELIAAESSPPPELKVGQVVAGRIKRYICGDNCYLIITTENGREIEGLCVAKECREWNRRAELPRHLVGRMVSVTIGRGHQTTASGIVMGEWTSFTAVRFHR